MALVFLEILSTALSITNLIIAKELIGIYLDQEGDSKYFDTAEIAKYVGILAGGLFVWMILTQSIDFYAHYVALLLKKINNGLMHKKLLKLSHRSLAM